MKYVIAVYRSREVAMRAYDFLLKNNVNAALVSTPRGANVGCGLSVKFAHADLDRVSAQLADAETFVGFFLVRLTTVGTVITKL